MGPVRQNPIQRTFCLFICVCIALCTIVAHSIAQNRPDSFSPYPPDNHHCFDDVYLREGGQECIQHHGRWQVSWLSTRPEVHNIWHCPAILTFTDNFLKFGYMVFSELTFTFAIWYRPSVCRLSVVCNARAPYSVGSNFPHYFYGIWYLGHPLTFTENFTEIVPGEPLCRGS